MTEDFIRYGLFVFGFLAIAFALSIARQDRMTRRILLSRIKSSGGAGPSGSIQFLRMKFQSLQLVFKFIDTMIGDAKRLQEIDGHAFRILLSVGVGAIVLAGASLLLTHSFIVGLVLGIIGSYYAFRFYMQIRLQAYSDLVLKSFPNAVDGLIRCLKAGFDLSRSLTIVSDELPRELQYEFKMMIRNRNLGQSLGDAMYYLASRLRSREAFFLATLIAVQERTGGPLVGALESLSQILKDRERLRQKRRVASSEARMSAMILGGLPVAVAVLLFSTNPSYRDILMETQTGRAALILGITLLLIGTIVMHRMIRMPAS